MTVEIPLSNLSLYKENSDMQSKLIALYKQPADASAFDEAYFNTHLPLIAKVPGLQKTVITRFTRTLMGDGYYLMAEMYFSDTTALKNGMRSPEMAAAGENLNSFAEGLVTLAFGEEERSAVNPAAGSTVPEQDRQGQSNHSAK
jgi:uncharacterized protein (TIGR02118 family)